MATPHDEFTKLRKLLTVKRYEQPPPGYYEHLRKRVISQLEAEELVEYSSWWQWLIEKFDARPFLVCVYGVVVSGLLLAGFRLSQIFESEVAATPIFTGPWLAVTPGSAPALPEDLDQNDGMDATVSKVHFLSKNAPSVLNAESSPILIKGVGGLRFSPMSTTGGER